MEENQNPTSPQPSKPSDVEVFLGALPPLVGSFAMKHNESLTAAHLAIGLAREMTGQMVLVGVCDQTSLCADGQPLALISGYQQAQNPSGIPKNLSQTLGNGHSRQGAAVAMFENQSVQKIQGL